MLSSRAARSNQLRLPREVGQTTDLSTKVPTTQYPTSSQQRSTPTNRKEMDKLRVLGIKNKDAQDPKEWHKHRDMTCRITKTVTKPKSLSIKTTIQILKWSMPSLTPTMTLKCSQWDKKTFTPGTTSCKILKATQSAQTYLRCSPSSQPTSMFSTLVTKWAVKLPSARPTGKPKAQAGGRKRGSSR